VVSGVPFVFPPDDLLATLVDEYFVRVNDFYPLLHRPTFERELADNLHRCDTGFASVVLLVCALAARYVHDPRVLVPGASEQSAGWDYFNQVQTVRRLILGTPCLYDMQWHCVRRSGLGCTAKADVARAACVRVSQRFLEPAVTLAYHRHRYPARSGFGRPSAQSVRPNSVCARRALEALVLVSFHVSQPVHVQR
jgi:hypothetical protein